MKQSDFASVLVEALKKAGFKYMGKIDVSKLNLEEWMGYSPQEMAARYAKEFNLVEINKILTILQAIYAQNQKGIMNFPLKNTLDSNNLPDLEYRFAFSNCGLIQKTGERANTEYRWLSTAAPLYSNAETIFNLFNNMRAFKLTPKERNFIEDNYTEGVEFLNEKLNPENLVEKKFQILRLTNYLSVKSRAKLMRESEVKTHLISSREIGRTPIVPVDKTPETNEAQALDQQSETQKKPKIKVAEGALFISTKVAKMYKKIIKHQNKELKAQRKYIKQLEDKLLNEK